MSAPVAAAAGRTLGAPAAAVATITAFKLNAASGAAAVVMAAEVNTAWTTARGAGGSLWQAAAMASIFELVGLVAAARGACGGACTAAALQVAPCALCHLQQQLLHRLLAKEAAEPGLWQLHELGLQLLVID